MVRLGNWRVALAALTLFTLLAGDAWRYLIGWIGWGALIALLLAGWVTVAVRDRVDLRRLPIALGAWLAIVTVSIVWSHYPAASAIGIPTTLATAFGGVVMALTLPLHEVARALGIAVRWILGLSLVFELAVAVFVGRPVLPLWVDYEGTVPLAFSWSRSLLFEGGRIQGIPGNANLLGLAALIGVIVFAVQLADRRISRVSGIAWISAAVLVLLLTRSATVLLAGVGVLVTLAVIIAARRLSGRGRAALYGSATVVSAAGVALVIAFRENALDIVGRSSDLTGRSVIWERVVGLIDERPVAGWGWVSYWAPWVDPYDDLVIIDGVRYLQAHNAWLDVTLQLGIIGLLAFSALVLTTLVRVTSWSVDAPRDTRVPGTATTTASADTAPPSATLRLLPITLLALLLVHSLAESRLLIEAGLFLLVYLAVSSSQQLRTPA